jgi:hypothetical protein
MTRQRRQGLGRTTPSPTRTDAVECAEVSRVAGHQGKPDAVGKKGGAAGADASKGHAAAAPSPRRSPRSAGGGSAVARGASGGWTTSNHRRSSHGCRQRWRRGPVGTRMRTLWITAWHRGALRMQASVTAGEKRRGMTTAMAFMQCLSRRWKAFGPCSGRGCARIAASHKTICRSLWASLRLCTM